MVFDERAGEHEVRLKAERSRGVAEPQWIYWLALPCIFAGEIFINAFAFDVLGAVPLGSALASFGTISPQSMLKEDSKMHARVTSLNGSPDDVEAGIANFRENVVGFASEERGKGAILLVDRASGNALAITLWEDEQAMQASEESANALRAQAAEQMGAAGQPEVARYEVAVFET